MTIDTTALKSLSDTLDAAQRGEIELNDAELDTLEKRLVHLEGGVQKYDAGLQVRRERREAARMRAEARQAEPRRRYEDLSDESDDDFERVVARHRKSGMSATAAMSAARRERPGAFAAYQRTPLAKSFDAALAAEIRKCGGNENVARQRLMQMGVRE